MIMTSIEKKMLAIPPRPKDEYVCNISKSFNLKFYSDYIAIQALKTIYGDFPIKLNEKKDIKVIYALRLLYIPIDESARQSVTIFDELVINLNRFSDITIDIDKI